MAEAALIRLTIDCLHQFISYHANLISNVRSEVDQLIDDLNYFEAFLEYASTRRIEDERQIALLSRVRDTVNKTNDAVDAYVTQKMKSKSSSWLRKFTSHLIKLDKIAWNVSRVRNDVEEKFGNREMLLRDFGININERVEVPLVREEKVVGLEDDTTKIIGILRERTQQLDVISIVGMPGLGKSTFARKIFLDTRIKREFPLCIWICVSKFQPEEVFLSILEEVTVVTEQMRRMRRDKLANIVKKLLDKKKFFIVMDDVWTTAMWNIIYSALPAHNRRGKILITSRQMDVAQHENTRRPSHELKLLGLEDSKKLLQYEVFGKPMWEPEFEHPGQLIAEKCSGLPLTIVVIGGIIRKKLSTIDGHLAKVTAWKEFSDSVPGYRKDDPSGSMEKVILLSYEELPYHVQSCFLYFGMFPEDMQIPTRKLFLMWIAEGLVTIKTHFSLEATAESYLDELINRNLVTVDKRGFDGKVKTCRIHNSLQDFCKKKAGEDKFLVEIIKSREGTLAPLVDDRVRRISIHSNIPTFLESRPNGRRVCSFVCFSQEGILLKPPHDSLIPKRFKRLRVLDVKPIKLSKIPNDTYKLFHLRHIHLTFNSKVLPQEFSRLWNVQTLIVETSERTLEIRADIWKMIHLKHMKTNVAAKLPEPANATDAQDGSNIQILGKILPECTGRLADVAPNLRRVSIRGKVESLLTESSFDHMVKLDKLEKLKLQNDKFSSQGSLSRLPSFDKFPPNLKILTLCSTLLDWNHMQVLGSLPNLQVLKLKDDAFTGNSWVTYNAGFEPLKALYIDTANLVIWRMSGRIFPNIIHLELHNCDDLQEVPTEFAKRRSLRVLSLNNCRTAAHLAKIERLKMEANAELTVTVFPSY